MRDLTQVPHDKVGAGTPVYEAQLRGTALARTTQVLGASFLITLHADTNYIRVNAINHVVLLKWANHDTEYVTAANFDEVIPAGAQRTYMVPMMTGGAPFTRIMLVGRTAGSTVIVIEK